MQFIQGADHNMYIFFSNNTFCYLIRIMLLLLEMRPCGTVSIDIHQNFCPVILFYSRISYSFVHMEINLHVH